MNRKARRGSLAPAPGALKKGGDTSEIVNIFVAVEGGPFGIFKHPFCCKISKELKERPFGEIFFPKNVSQCRRKIEKGDLLVSPGMVCYAGKQEKPIWFCSVGQMMQFGAIIFCGTFDNYFGQFVWIEKKRVTIIVAFHFMKRRLKRCPQLLGQQRRQERQLYNYTSYHKFTKPENDRFRLHHQ